MQMIFALFLVFFSYQLAAQTNHERVQSLKSVKRIAFGSCNNQNDKQPLWKDLILLKPDLWIWGGDNIYADWGKSESIEMAYRELNDHPDYKQFKATTAMLGTWDDHDYGLNNAGGSLPFKKESQRLFMDFLDVPLDDPRRLREGIYNSTDIGEGSEKIKFIMLDNRYFKDSDPEYGLLGKEQWLWLENEFKTSTANLHIIATGLSIYSPLIPYTNEWREYPKEYNRMQELLKTYQVKAPLFLSGDKHFSSIYKFSGQLEFMSSGMTHTADRRTWWYLGRKYPTTYFGIAYGVIDVAWEEDVPVLKLFMRNGSKDIHTRKFKWQKDTWMKL